MREHMDMHGVMEAPVGAARVVGVDVARAVAVLGMVLVNFKVLSNTREAGPDWLVALAERLDGRASALFVVLAGVGVGMLTRRAREDGSPRAIAAARAMLLQRAVTLGIMGLALCTLWPMDILRSYGIFLAIAALVFAAPKRALLGGAAALIAAFPLVTMAIDYNQGWDPTTHQYLDQWSVAGMARHLLFNGFHPALPWMAFLLTGMWLSRLDLHDARTRRLLLLGGLGATLGAEALSAWLLSTLTSDWGQAIALIYPGPPMPLYMISATGTALVTTALCLEWAARRPASRAVSALATTGTFALTLYIAHIALGMGALLLTDLLDERTLAHALGAGLGFWLLSIPLTNAFAARFGVGPLESLLRIWPRPRAVLATPPLS